MNADIAGNPGDWFVTGVPFVRIEPQYVLSRVVREPTGLSR